MYILMSGRAVTLSRSSAITADPSAAGPRHRQ
jgi:hypothetical protein